MTTVASNTGRVRGIAGTNTTNAKTPSAWLFLTNTAGRLLHSCRRTSFLTASFLKDSAGTTFAASNLGALTNLPVSFSGVDGGISSAQSVIQTSATATATFTGTTSGAGSGSATVDGVTSSATVDVTVGVTSVSSSPSSHYYKAGQTVPVTVTFSGTVTVTGTPKLALSDGGTANYASGSGGSVLTFNYTVGASDTSSHLDIASASALTLNSGTINSGGVAASLTLPTPGAAGSLSANTTLVIDTTAPTVTVAPPRPRMATPRLPSPTSSPMCNDTNSQQRHADLRRHHPDDHRYWPVAVTPGSGASSSTNYTVTLSSLTGNGRSASRSRRNRHGSGRQHQRGLQPLDHLHRGHHRPRRHLQLAFRLDHQRRVIDPRSPSRTRISACQPLRRSRDRRHGERPRFQRGGDTRLRKFDWHKLYGDHFRF